MREEIKNRIIQLVKEGKSSISIFRLLKKEFPNENINKEEVKSIISSVGVSNVDQLNVVSFIEDDKKDFIEMLEKLKKKNITLIEKKEILIYLISRITKRIKSLEKLQVDQFSVQIESLISKYHAELRAYVETLTKIEEDLAPQRQEILNVIDIKLQILLQSFYRVIAEVAPERLELIKSKLKEEIRKSSIAFQTDKIISIENSKSGGNNA